MREDPLYGYRVDEDMGPNWFEKEVDERKGDFLYNIVYHDCLPNAFLFTKDAEIVFYTSRDIMKGEEITISFLGGGETWEARRGRLLSQFGIF